MKKREDNATERFFSVITVCLNSEKTISNTIESVLSQECNDYEYIIIDGQSNDETMNIVKLYEERFRDKAIPYFYYSNKDEGLYDAMNKGVRISRGQYIMFLNSDDYIYDSKVLDRIKNEIYEYKYPDIIVGNTCIVYGCNSYIQYPPRKGFEDKLLGRMPFIHQSSFTKKELLDEDHFSLKYLVSSDYDFFLRQRLKHKRFHISDCIICFYTRDGLSSKVGDKIIWNEYKNIKHNAIDEYHLVFDERVKMIFFSFVYHVRLLLSSNVFLMKLFYYLKNEERRIFTGYY